MEGSLFPPLVLALLFAALIQVLDSPSIFSPSYVPSLQADGLLFAG